MGIVNLYFCISILIIIFLKFYYKRKKISKLAAKIPKVDTEIPFLGVTHKFIGAKLKDYFPIIFKIIDINQPIQRLWFGSKLTIFANTPEQYKTIFISPHCLKKPALIYDGFFCKKGLLSSNGEIQDRHRKILVNSMSSKRLNVINSVFNEKSKKFVMKIKEKLSDNEIDVLNDIAIVALEALMKGNFSHDEDCSKSKVIEAFEKGKDVMMKKMLQPWMSIDLIYKLSKLSKDAAKTFKPVHDKIDEILKKNQHLRIYNEKKNLPVIEQLLNFKNSFNEEEIRDQMFVLLYGGHETTST